MSNVVNQIKEMLEGSTSDMFSSRDTIESAVDYALELIKASGKNELDSSIMIAIVVYHNTLVKALGRSVCEIEAESFPWNPDSHWDNHPDYPIEDWADEVVDNNTRQGYMEWVNSEIKEAL